MVARCRKFLLIIALGGLSASLRAEEPKRAGPDWWSLRPLALPEVPIVKRAEWVRHPIDAFVLARLEAKNLAPSLTVDRATLIRRVTFDLIGLPPTPNEVSVFVADRSEEAYAKLIDRLLASPHYGERWGRHWLDVARFGESHGFERDQPRDNAWRYRDYVIKAFNDDKPYADFVKEQIAGDAVGPRTDDGQVATGFLVCGPWDQVGHTSGSPSVRGKAREDELEDLLATVGQTFLGLTVNCARCHDHKFDPVPTKDYYRLKAIFDGVHPGDRELARPVGLPAWEEKAVRHQKQLEEIQRQISALERRGRQQLKQSPDADLPRPFAQWTFDGDARDRIGSLHGLLKGGAKIIDGRLTLDGKDSYVETAPLDRELRSKTLEAWIALGNLEQRGGAAISVETAEGGLFDAIVFGELQPGHWLAGSNGYVRSRTLKATAENAKPDEWVHCAITYAPDGRISLYRNGESYGDSYVPTGEAGKPVVFAAKQTHVLFGKRHTGGGNVFLAGAIDEARLYDRALSADEVRASFKAGTERVSRRAILAALTEVERRDLVRLDAELTALRATQPERPKPVFTYAVGGTQPAPTHLLNRGDFTSLGELVVAGPPSQVKGPTVEFDTSGNSPEGDRRRRFAEWVVDPRNPLTWRVMANRVWQHHLGEGIVRTPNDFGFNGDRPTHPELLDWLATKLRDGGGNLKPLHKAIMLSATYQQASTFEARAAEVDADNRLLWRFAPRRLDAEAVRDAMLAVSGRLNRQAGGPSFRPFTIEIFNSTFYHLFDRDEAEFNRRSVYRMIIQSARDPLLDVLDCPDPSVKTPKRVTTTTPLQALTLMNNSFVQRQAQAWVDRVRQEAGDNANDQIALAYRYAFGRPPTEKESALAGEVLSQYGLKPVCWALLNASEFVSLR